jgi:hypothetical protein
MALALGIAQAGARSQRVWIVAAAGAVVLLASLLNFLNHNKYPLFSAEVGLVVLALLTASGVVFALYRSVGRGGRLLLQILLLFLGIDLNFDLDAGLAFVAAVAAVIVLRRHVMAALGIAFAVVLASQAGQAALGGAEAAAEPTASAAPSSDAPILVHLILDEHVGIDGLPLDVPGASSLRDHLVAFYRRHGFRLFAGAYSEYMHTTNSIPQMLNFGAALPWVAESVKGVTTENTAYFARLAELGYDIHVYQNDFVDYCQEQQVRSCAHYDGSSMGPVALAEMPTFDKAKLISYGFWELSSAVSFLTNGYNALAASLRARGVALPPVETQPSHQPSTVGAMLALEALTADLAHAAPGQAYFAHILFPHYPYVARPDCTLKPVAAWLQRRSLTASWQARQAAYFEQIRCLTKKLDTLLGTLAGSPQGKRAIVVLHGDHGSRITRLDPLLENEGQYTDRDLIDGYATLFAVRAPAISPGYEDKRVPVARLLEVLARSGVAAADIDVPPDFAPSVMLTDADRKPTVRRALPPAWVRP